MSRSESASARRWFPSRLFLPHAPRKTLAFTAAEVAGATIVPFLPLVALFAWARWRRRVRVAPAAGATATAAAAALHHLPPPPALATAAAPGARVPVWHSPLT
jgi:hypothetical protein